MNDFEDKQVMWVWEGGEKERLLWAQKLERAFTLLSPLLLLVFTSTSKLAALASAGDIPLHYFPLEIYNDKVCWSENDLNHWTLGHCQIKKNFSVVIPWAYIQKSKKVCNFCSPKICVRKSQRQKYTNLLFLTKRTHKSERQKCAILYFFLQ